MAEGSSSTPLEPANLTSNENPTASPDAVGPGRPPQDKRWKKGGPSPNPRGRPRKEQSMLPDVRKAFEEAINQKISVARGDRQVLMTRVEIGLEQLLNQFAKGDRHARRDLMDYADKLGIDFLAKHRQSLEQVLTPNYQAILDSFLARNGGAAVAPSERVLASPQLLDDDAPAESEATSPLPPEPKAKMEFPEPTPIPGKKYPKPFNQMTPLQRKIYYPEWWEEFGALWEKYGR